MTVNWQRLPDARPQGAGMTDRSGIYVWRNEKGEAVEGVFGGLEQGKYGMLARIGGQLVALKGYATGGKVVDEFARIAPGTLVRLEYLESKPSKDPAKKPMNLFDIFTAPATQNAAAAAAPLTPTGQAPTQQIEDALIAKLGIGPAQELLNMLKRMGGTLGTYEDSLRQVAVQHGILKDPDGTKF